MKSPEQRQKNGHARYTEPGRLVVGRGDGEIQECAGLVPHAAVIGCGHAEAVIAGRQVRILHLAVVNHLPPVLILSLQLEAEVSFFRDNQAQRCVINREIANQRRQPQARG